MKAMPRFSIRKRIWGNSTHRHGVTGLPSFGPPPVCRATNRCAFKAAVCTTMVVGREVWQHVCVSSRPCWLRPTQQWINPIIHLRPNSSAAPASMKYRFHLRIFFIYLFLTRSHQEGLMLSLGKLSKAEFRLIENCPLCVCSALSCIY